MAEPINPLRELAIVKGWPATVEALGEWRASPLRAIAPWVLVSLGCAGVLLTLTYVIGTMSTPDPSASGSVPADMAADPWGYAVHIFKRNMLVLALHACACFAGYIIHVALPDAEHRDTGMLLEMNRKLGLIAMIFVPFATIFSIVTQAWVLGEQASTLSLHLHLSLPQVMLSVLPHALPELTAVFLPLGAWIVAARRHDFDSLIAATLVSVAIAVPVVAAAALFETGAWPDRIQRLQRGDAPPLVGQQLGDLSELRSYNCYLDYCEKEAKVVRKLWVRESVNDEPYHSRDTAMKAATAMRMPILVTRVEDNQYFLYFVIGGSRPLLGPSEYSMKPMLNRNEHFQIEALVEGTRVMEQAAGMLHALPENPIPASKNSQ